MLSFLSPSPEVRLVNVFHEPYNNAVATARTCYSSRVIHLDDVTGAGQPEEVQRKRQAMRDRIASSIYEAGHHTTLQHAHVQFTLSKVSRHFLWSFLHASPFYNSEQQSQRYVHMKPGQVIEPDLGSEDLQQLYRDCVNDQLAVYETLSSLLMPVAARHYYGIFPARRKQAEKYDKEVQKKAQEVARYVLPVGYFANLYHTVSLLSLLRYHHMAQQPDTPAETRWVIDQMMAAVRAHDPLLDKVIEAPLPPEAMPETAFWQAPLTNRRAFLEHFDASLGSRTSLLVDYKLNTESVMAEAVREVLGLHPGQLSDAEALDLALNPARNGVLATTLNTSTLSKLTRVLHHGHYSFRKKLSHAADSQDQRHRMVPGSRPVLGLHLDTVPDYITPRLILDDPQCQEIYSACMTRIWGTIERLLNAGAPLEAVSYLLPNAVSVRFTESGDLLNLHHKLRARLCYNAQEEIWQASLDELEQITAVHPGIGPYLRPPCGLRQMAARTPFCPEGARYCGVPVWRLEPAQYQRVI
ncbi:MAG: FAD-dependent thymidylate synthase [Candidatus Sericytochromatia bacterium]